MGRIPAAVSPLGMLKITMNTGIHFASFDSCPATGTIEYISDFNNSVINIYAGNFAGQAPCGQITGLTNPQGLFVRKGNLYVANTAGGNILVFQRGGTTPIQTLTDPGVEYPVDVTVARDGTVIASNIFQPNGLQAGSISTWNSTGTFVGNFPMINDLEGLYVTVQKSGKMYFNDIDLTSIEGLTWTGRCPAGVCGAFTSTGAQSGFPGGLRSADNEDVVQIDQHGNTVNTYESIPNGRTKCSIIGAADASADDISKSEHHLFYADSVSNIAGEIGYPTCAAIGTVQGNPLGAPMGAAVDAPEAL